MYARGFAALLAAMAIVSCDPVAPDFYVNGAAVFIETAAPFARQPALPSRVESTIEAALAYWGGDWTHIQGRAITFGGDYVACAGHDRALGCYDGDIRVATADPGVGTFQCVEQTVLVHEIGHAVIGDAMHEDPRWMQFDWLAEEFAGRVGWTESGEVACDIYPSVWRHPADRS